MRRFMLHTHVIRDRAPEGLQGSSAAEHHDAADEATKMTFSKFDRDGDKTLQAAELKVRAPLRLELAFVPPCVCSPGFCHGVGCVECTVLYM